MQRLGFISIIVLISLLTLSFLSGIIVPYDPDSIDLDSLKQSPSAEHPFGTDQKGRDILARVLFGGRISISVAVLAALLSMGIGLSVGVMSGYFGGRIDTLLMSFVDLILSFPSLLLAIGISLIMPPGIFTVMIAIALVGWASYARLIRGYVLKLREEPFVEAARAIGCGRGRIMLVHILPQCIPLSLVISGLKIGGFILTEASLNFLGLGAQPPTASWGSMISSGRAYIVSAPWVVLYPGLAIVCTALCFNLAGDSLSRKFGINKDSLGA